MRVIVIMGSRNPEGQTGQAAAAYIEGLKNGDATVEQVFLPKLEILRCRQCRDDGWGQCIEEGVCCQKDDFASVVDKIRAADAVVFATPVYYGDLSESLRALLDRLRRICINEKGRPGIYGKLATGICIAGGGGGGAPNCAESLQRVLHHINLDVVDVIPGRRQNLDLKKEVCRISGKWLAGHPINK